MTTADVARFRMGVNQPPIIADECANHIITNEARRNQWRRQKYLHRLDMHNRGQRPPVELWRAP
tara:strand:+ start:66071 stop:66262 length:192 start_codon:yes stop_codon:yes gene_type:complete